MTHAPRPPVRPRLRFAMPRAVPPGFARRVPPAIFPPLLGALALSLAWLAGVAAFALPEALAQLFAGMIAALAVVALAAYGLKLARRPAVLAEDLAILPGRAGVAAGVLTVYLAAALCGSLGAVWTGRGVLLLGLGLHGVVLAVLARSLWRGPGEQRRVSPMWHLALTGLIVAARAAVALGWPGLAGWLFWPSAAAAALIYALSARQLAAMRVPAPLRPLLAIHLAPLALFATVALSLGWTGAGTALAWAALAVALALAASARWLLEAGFSALWGALCFPLAATAGAWVALWRIDPTEPHRLISGALLVAATLVVVPVLALIWRDWARGRLAVKTNAAIA